MLGTHEKVIESLQAAKWRRSFVGRDRCPKPEFGHQELDIRMPFSFLTLSTATALENGEAEYKYNPPNDK